MEIKKMNLHTVKLKPVDWCRIFEGSTTFWFSETMQNFQKGDDVVFLKISGIGGVEPGTELYRAVGDVYPIDGTQVIYALLRAAK